MGAWDLGRPNFDDTTWQVAEDTMFPGRCYFFKIYVAFLQFISVYQFLGWLKFRLVNKMFNRYQ